MDCHSCGMYIDESLSECPKCDAGVYAHNHAETITVDIAHNRQSVAQASTQFYDALESATLQQFGKLRIIVGSGLIKNDIGPIKAFTLFAYIVNRENNLSSDADFLCFSVARQPK